MKKISYFFRNLRDSKGCDVKAAMLKVAFSGELFTDEVVNCIECEEADPEHVPAIIFGLTRATASFLKSLEKSDIHAKKLFEEMLSVWLYDVDDYAYFDKWIQEMNQRKLGLK